MTDFEEALAVLKSMSKPCWRRPNDAGNWGIVTGCEWKAIAIDRDSEVV